MNIPITTPHYHTYLSHHFHSTADYFGMGRPISYSSTVTTEFKLWLR